MWNFLKKKKDPEKPDEIDFDQMVATLNKLSTSAQMTFLYRMVQTLSPKMCTTLMKYAVARRATFKKIADDMGEQSNQ